MDGWRGVSEDLANGWICDVRRYGEGHPFYNLILEKANTVNIYR